MNGSSIIWLLLNTKTGRAILVLLIVYALITALKWWSIPFLLLIIGLVWLGIYYENKQIEKFNADNESSNNKNEIRAYFLKIGKGKNRANEFDNKIFKIKFAMAEDLCGMKVTITNTSNEVIDIDWPSFAINKSRVDIDGVIYLSYDLGGKLNPGESVTKLLQRHKDKFSWGYEKLFDLKEIDKEELKYDVTFDLVDSNAKRKNFLIDVYTTLKITK